MARKRLAAMAEYARTAEQIGLRSFLVTEGPATDALAVTQHIASITSRIGVGTGIANIYTRHPSVTAAHALTIDALAPGRLLLGLGTSHRPVNTAYGINMDKPLTAMRDCVATLRKVFRGEPLINRPGFVADQTRRANFRLHRRHLAKEHRADRRDRRRRPAAKLRSARFERSRGRSQSGRAARRPRSQGG